MAVKLRAWLAVDLVLEVVPGSGVRRNLSSNALPLTGALSEKKRRGPLDPSPIPSRMQARVFPAGWEIGNQN